MCYSISIPRTGHQMDTTKQIALYLKVSPIQVKRVEAWDKVYLVVLYGRRATFVSKKEVNPMSEKIKPGVPNWELNPPTDRYNRIANWCLCGFENEVVKLLKKDQLKVLGFYVGKGSISVQFSDVYKRWVAINIISVSFGTDSSYGAMYDLQTAERLQ